MRKEIFDLEREMIFDAALKLIKESKYYATTISEIAYHASLTERTTQLLFQSREALILELSEYTRGRVLQVIANALKDEQPFEEQFFNVWLALYQYYVRNPEMRTFMEQRDALLQAAQADVVEQCFEPLVQLFRKRENGVIPFIRPETLSKVFHGNVMTSAKIHAEVNLRYDHEEVVNIAKVLLHGMTYYSQRSVNR